MKQSGKELDVDREEVPVMPVMKVPSTFLFPTGLQYSVILIKLRYS